MQALSPEQLSYIRMPYQTNHAQTRMSQRGFNNQQIALALKYGRVIHAKGVVFVVVGRKEVSHYAKKGINLTGIEGIQLLMTTDNVLVTVYRNHDLSQIKKSSKKRH